MMGICRAGAPACRHGAAASPSIDFVLQGALGDLTTRQAERLPTSAGIVNLL